MHRRTVQSPAAPPRPESVPLPDLLDRAVVAAFAALVVARPLVAGDDPGRLRLTSPGGPLSFNLCLFGVLVAALLWRAAYGRTRPIRLSVVALLLANIANVGVVAWLSSQMGDRYARPGVFVFWEWVAVAVALLLTRWVVPSLSDGRGLLNVLLATAVSVAGLGIYQALSHHLGLPTSDVGMPQSVHDLAGDDEFYPDLNRPPPQSTTPRGTFDSTETFLVYLFLMLPAAVAVSRARRGTAWARWVPAVPVVLILGAVAALLGRPFEVERHLDAAVNLIGEHPWLGVGPGNFSRAAPGALAPHSAWLGLAATTGLVGLGVFVGALAAGALAFRRPADPDPWELPPAGPRWEFYLGGIAGLLLGFIWNAGAIPPEAPPDELFKLGASAVLRAILWFAAFALLETVRSAPKALIRAILIGLAFALLFGLLSDAPGRPTILFLVAVMLALAVSFRHSPEPARTEGTWTKPVLVAGVIAAVGLAVAFLVTAAVPGWATASAVREARMSSRHFPEAPAKRGRERPGPERANALSNAEGYLRGNILKPLTDAADRDPGNAPLLLEIARWQRPLWQYQLLTDREGAARIAKDTRQRAERAGQLDPRNLSWQRNLFEALLLYRRYSTAKEAERIVALNKLIAQIAEREPESEVPLRFRVVQMLLDRGEADTLEPEVTRLFELNRAEGHGHLAENQKEEVIQRSKKVLQKLPKALEEEWVR